MTDSKADVTVHTQAPAEDAEMTVCGLDIEPSNEPLTLVSGDGVRFTLIERKNAFISKLVAQSLELDSKADEVPVPGVKGATLKLIIEFMEEHKGVEAPIIEKPLKSKEMKDCVKHPWDAPFIARVAENRQDLYDFIIACNYMDVKSGMHLGCAKVASMIKGQPLEKIKDILAVDLEANKRAAEPKTTESKE